MGVKVTFSGAKLAKKIEGITSKAQEAVSTQIAVDSNQFIPKDLGALESSVFADSDFKNGQIIWGVDYAVFVYYNVHRNLRTGKNKDASHFWFEVAKSQYLGNWIWLVSNVYKKDI